MGESSRVYPFLGLGNYDVSESHDNLGTLGNIIGLDESIARCCLDICINVMKEPGLLLRRGCDQAD